jgi:hypothetical protein
MYPWVWTAPTCPPVWIHLGPGTRIGMYEFTARGVRFEHYETGTRNDAKGIHRTPEVRPVAWFRDPAGNILSIIQQ